MTKKIDLMETGISLARLFRLAFKNWLIIGFSFVLGLGLAYGYTQSSFMDQGTYQGSGSVQYKTSTNATVLNTVTEIVRSTNVSLLAAAALAEDTIPVTLASGLPITPEIIRNTLTAATTTNSLRITITFTHPEQAIVVPVINAVIDATIADGNASYTVIANNLILGDYATTTTFDGPSSTLYLAIGALLGLMIGGAVGVLWDAFKGTIYATQDLKELSLSTFFYTFKTLIPVSVNVVLAQLGLKKRGFLEEAQAKQIMSNDRHLPILTTLQNNLESTRPQASEALTTLVTSPLPLKALAKFVLAYAQQSSLQERKTLIIDFDLMTTPLTTYLETHHVSLKKKTTSKSENPFQTLKPNLDVYVPEKNLVPATVIRAEDTLTLIQQAKKKYDHVIIIGPSVLPDASVMSIISYVNSAIIVSRAEDTTTTQVIKSYNALVEANLVAIENVIVNERIKYTYPFIREWLTKMIQAQTPVKKK